MFSGDSFYTLFWSLLHGCLPSILGGHWYAQAEESWLVLLLVWGMGTFCESGKMSLHCSWNRWNILLRMGIAIFKDAVRAEHGAIT